MLLFLFLVCLVVSLTCDTTIFHDCHYALFGLDDVAGAIIGSSIIGGAGSLLGNIFGSKSQSSANQANLAIARETNANNLQIARETNAANLQNYKDNRDWTESMWNKQNEYNTPLAQAERLKAAGLNPGLVMGGTNSGVASSVNGLSPAESTTGAPMTTGNPMQGYTPDTSGISNAANMIGNYFMNKEVNSANAAQARANAYYSNEQGRYYSAKANQEILESMSREGVNREMRRKYALANGVYAHNLDAINQRFGLENEIQKSQIQKNIADIAVQSLNAEMSKLKIKYLPEQLKAEIGLLESEMAMNGNLSEKYAQEALESKFRQAGLALDYKTKDGLRTWLIGQAKSDFYINRQKYYTYRDFGTFDVGSKATQRLNLSGGIPGFAKFGGNVDHDVYTRVGKR